MDMRKREPFFRYADKSSPDYTPQYGKKYTARQVDILAGRLPLNDTYLNELSILYRKAERLGDTEHYKIALRLYQKKKLKYAPKYSVKEAKIIMQRMTP